MSYCCRGQSIQGNAGTFSEQVIASIIYDSRCGMSDVAFCTAPPTGGPSCFFFVALEYTLLLLLYIVIQGYEDWQRHKADNEVNNREAFILRNNVAEKVKSKDIHVGDIVKVTNKMNIPCDMVLLSSSNADGTCYITSANLDGETNLKVCIIRVLRLTCGIICIFVCVEHLIYDCRSLFAFLYELHRALFVTFMCLSLAEAFTHDRIRSICSTLALYYCNV